MAREGAKHVYLLDFSDQVMTFAKALQADFPDTKVQINVQTLYCLCSWNR
jgi:hypothetical protein